MSELERERHNAVPGLVRGGIVSFFDVIEDQKKDNCIAALEAHLTQAAIDVADAESKQDMAEAELVALTARYAERRWVDMTPDDDLPVRLLSIYIDDTYWSDNTAGVEPTNPVVVAMNEHREQRNVILRRALDRLRAERSTPRPGAVRFS